jgi:branched-chain amino acid transport system permease protein
MRLSEGPLFEFLQQVLNGLSVGGTYALIAIGVALILGVGRIGNFAHGELVMSAAFSLQLLVARRVPFVAASVVAVAVGAAMAMLSNRLVFRRVIGQRLFTVFIAAIALSTVLQNVALALFGAAPRHVRSPLDAWPIRAGPFVLAGPRWFALLGSLAAFIALTWFLARTDTGRRIRAMGENPTAAAVAGINASRALDLTFGVSGVLAGLAALLLVPTLGVFPTMGVELMLKAFVIVLVTPGSLIKIFGVSLMVGVGEALAIGYGSVDLRDAVVFLFLVAFLLAKPSGFIRVSRMLEAGGAR